jgi:hypothetical protein
VTPISVKRSVKLYREKGIVPFQFGTRAFDALFKLDTKQAGLAFVDLASDPQKAPIVLDQSLGAPFF